MGVQGRVLVYEGHIHAENVGGGRRHFVGLANALAARPEFERVIVVLPAYEGLRTPVDEFSPAVDVRHVRMGRRLGVASAAAYELRKTWVLWRLRRNLPRGSFLLTRLSYHGVALVVARLLGMVVVVEANGVPLDEVRDRGQWCARIPVRFTSWLQIRVAHAVVAVTPGIARRLRVRCHVRVVANGAALDDLPVLEEPPTRRRMAFAGTLAPWYDLPLVLRGLAELVRGYDETWHLDIFGDGEMQKEWSAMCDEFGIGSRVAFHGWLDPWALADALRACWVCLAPIRPKGKSAVCGSPLKVFEYVALGRPVVAADVDGVTELSLPGLHKYRAGDVQAFLCAVRSAATWQRPSADLLMAVRSSISWHARACEVVDLLESVNA